MNASNHSAPADSGSDDVGQDRVDVAGAEADAIALLAALRSDNVIGRSEAVRIAVSGETHRVFVAFLLVERALILQPGTGPKGDPVAVEEVAVELLRDGRAHELRSLLRRHVGNVSDDAAAAFLSALAGVALRDATVSPGAALRAWGLHVAANPGGRQYRRPLQGG